MTNNIAKDTENKAVTKVSPNPEDCPPTRIVSGQPAQQQIRVDFNILLKYATTRGLALPTDVKLGPDTSDTDVITGYNSMIQVVTPATVQSIRYIHKYMLGEDGEDRKWYRTPIITKCLVIAIVALILLIGVSLSPEVNGINQEAGILASSGKVLLLNLLLICSASLLGVMFYLLKTISNKIKNYTLLPIDSIDLNATILIGIMSGFIMAELFSFSAGTLGGSIVTQKMTLALLGGFASDAIFSVLKGIVSKLKALFATDTGA